MKIIIVDITGANLGSEPRVLEAVSQAFPNEVENTFIVYRSDQKSVVNGYPDERLRPLPRMAHFNQVASFIQREFLDGMLENSEQGVASMTVVSFHPAVLKLREYLATNMQSRVTSLHLARLLSSGPRNAPGSLSSRTLAGLLSESDALACVQRALSGAKATDARSAIRLSDIRVYLEREEPRLRKTNPGARAQGVIGALVELAVRNGVVVVDRDVDAVNPPIWLRQPGANGSAGSGNSGHSGEAPSGLAMAAGEEAKTASGVSAAAMVVRQAGSAGTGPDAKKPSRSDQFVDNLRGQGLGPFSRIRGILYDCLEEVMTNGNGLKKDAISVIGATVVKAESAISASDSDKTVPWRKVREFLRNLLSRRPVLLTAEGKLVGHCFGTLCQPVEKLAADWRLELDGKLVVALVRCGMKVHEGDLPFIAGALFNDRSDVAEGKAGEVIDFLIRKGRLIDRERYLVEVEEPKREARSPEIIQPEAGQFLPRN